MTEQQRQHAILTAQQMTGALNSVKESLDEARDEWRKRDRFLTAYGRRNRVLAWLAGAAAVTAISLAVAVAVLFTRVSDSTATISQVRAANVNACRVGNESRRQQVTLWEHVAAVSMPPPGETAAQRTQNAKVLAAFLAYVHRVFAARNCGQLYRIP